MTSEKEEVTTGTCELCMGTQSMTKQYFYFQDETGKVHVAEGFMWSWGDLFEIHVDNIPHFAAWVEKQEIDPPKDEHGYDYAWLCGIVDAYEASYENDEADKWVEDHVRVLNNVVEIVFKTKQDVQEVGLEKILERLECQEMFPDDFAFGIPEGHSLADKEIVPGEKAYLTFYTGADNDIVTNFLIHGSSWRDYTVKEIVLGTLPCKVVLVFSTQGMLPEIEVENI